MQISVRVKSEFEIEIDLILIRKFSEFWLFQSNIQ